jgi:cytochrome o ubiquinol oxidase subunit 2
MNRRVRRPLRCYSGAGFSDMHFRTVATSREDFDAWIARARASGNALDEQTYRALKQPSSKDPVTIYATFRHACSRVSSINTWPAMATSAARTAPRRCAPLPPLPDTVEQ